MLFKKYGMVKVRLQQIADEAFVSVGNLAYHYSNKEAIVLKLYNEIKKQQEILLAEYRIVPLFDNIDRLISHTYRLQEKHVFFYLDTLEIIRAYPAIAEVHQQHIDFQINQLEFMMTFNVARAALNPEPRNGVFKQLAKQIWMTMNLWLHQKTIRSDGNLDIQNYRMAIWNLLIPHFSDMGKREFEQMLQMPYGLYE